MTEKPQDPSNIPPEPDMLLVGPGRGITMRVVDQVQKGQAHVDIRGHIMQQVKGEAFNEETGEVEERTDPTWCRLSHGIVIPLEHWPAFATAVQKVQLNTGKGGAHLEREGVENVHV